MFHAISFVIFLDAIVLSVIIKLPCTFTIIVLPLVAHFFYFFSFILLHRFSEWCAWANSVFAENNCWQTNSLLEMKSREKIECWIALPQIQLFANKSTRWVMSEIFINTGSQSKARKIHSKLWRTSKCTFLWYGSTPIDSSIGSN